jgi:hypothetical protein
MVIDQKQLENMEYFSRLHSMINGARCTCETKSRIAMAETAFSKKKTLFTLELTEEINCRIWNIALCVLKLGRLGKEIRITWNGLERGTENSGDQLDRYCEK